jgi:hypothetical protein
MIKNIIKRFADKKLQEELNIKNKLLADALIYLEQDLHLSDDIVEYSAINDMIYDIENSLNIPQNKRITKKRWFEND